MKNKKTLFLSATKILFVMVSSGIMMTACVKDLTNNQQSDMTAETAAMQSEYNLAKQANDSLALFHDSLLMCHANSVHHDSTHYITMMHHCDHIYHNHDSLMMIHHNAMHGSSSGGMMNGSGGMMGTNNSMNMNCTMNGMLCETAIESLHTVHANHHP